MNIKYQSTVYNTVRCTIILINGYIQRHRAFDSLLMLKMLNNFVIELEHKFHNIFGVVVRKINHNLFFLPLLVQIICFVIQKI
jgi:hypothetical protein